MILIAVVISTVVGVILGFVTASVLAADGDKRWEQKQKDEQKILGENAGN